MVVPAWQQHTLAQRFAESWGNVADVDTRFSKTLAYYRKTFRHLSSACWVIGVGVKEQVMTDPENYPSPSLISPANYPTSFRGKNTPGFLQAFTWEITYTLGELTGELLGWTFSFCIWRSLFLSGMSPQRLGFTEIMVQRCSFGTEQMSHRR